MPPREDGRQAKKNEEQQMANKPPVKHKAEIKQEARSEYFELLLFIFMNGGPRGTRTPDLLGVNQLL